MIEWCSLEIDQVLKELKVDPNQGLNEAEVKRRLIKYGYNDLEKEEKLSSLILFLNQFKNFLIIILIFAIILSAFVGEVVDAIIIGIIVIFCAVLGFIQEYRAERALEALKKMLSPTVTVIREGREEEISSKELVPGDIILLEAGDKIPCDGRLIEVYSLQCDEAPLTGESLPVEKDIKVLTPSRPVADQKNMVFAGTIVTYGRGKAICVATGMNTEFGKIAKEVATVSVEKTPLEKRTEEIGRWLGIISISVCIGVSGFIILKEIFTGKIDFPFIITMVMFAISLAVAAVPEALAAVVTGTLAIGMHQMAKRNALIRKMPAVETLGSTTVICSDKTGTLTKGEMTVRKIFTNTGWVDITGIGYTPEGEIKASDLKSLNIVLIGGLLCNDALLQEKDQKWFIKGDPTEGALIVLAKKAGIDPTEVRLKNPRIKEIPFSSERKRMTTLHQMENGKHIIFMKGAPEVILDRCKYLLKFETRVELTEIQRKEILKANEGMANEALRVLGLAYKEYSDDIEFIEEYIEKDMVFLGLIGMMDPPREEAKKAINICKEVGIRPVMITGDHKLTALAIGKEMDIYKPGDYVITGDELEKMSEEDLEKIVDRVSVYARVSPFDKLKIVKAWKRKGEVVAMTGDGVNDAPALKHADIGIAMGITGTDVTKEAADMILTDDNFATIVNAIERGRWIYENIKKYLAYLLQCNVTEVIVIGGIVLLMGPEFLPLLPAAILYMNLATDGLPALALGVSPPDPDIMKKPPRDPKESIFGWEVKSFILLAVLIECPLFYFIFFQKLTDILHARTAVFFLFIVVELVVALNCRSLLYSIFKVPPHKLLILAVVWELILITMLIQIPSIRNAFGITKPSFSDLAVILGFGFIVFFLIEIIKSFLRKKILLKNKKNDY